MICHCVRTTVLLLSVAVALGCTDPSPSVSIERGDQTLEPIAQFRVDVARTAAERAAGLRGAEPLCDDCGLWIEFPLTTEACIVNDGVSFALDVVYVTEAGSVVAVERDVPAADATARCHSDVRSILEVSAGAASVVAIGDRVYFSP